MRSIFSLLGLLAVVLAIGLLVKKQLAPSANSPMPAPQATPQQTQQQFKQALDAAMQTPRVVPDEK
jgi:energy-converting hydrogenase Eha subunit F